MSEAARHLLETFRELSEVDKRKVLTVLLREAIQVSNSAPSDDDLTAAADEVFLDLDRAEAGA